MRRTAPTNGFRRPAPLCTCVATTLVLLVGAGVRAQAPKDKLTRSDKKLLAAAFDECDKTGPPTGPPCTQIVDLRTQWCEEGHISSCEYLGSWFAWGSKRLVPEKDPKRAVEFWGKGCQAGDLDACYAVGVLTSAGNWVSRDEARAAKFFKADCLGGNISDGCRQLAYRYLVGHGVPKNEALAANYIAKCRGCPEEELEHLKEAQRMANACEKTGNLKSCKWAAFRYRSLYPPQAVALYERRCDLGDADACASIGDVYAGRWFSLRLPGKEGSYSPYADEEEASSRYEVACMLGSDRGCRETAKRSSGTVDSSPALGNNRVHSGPSLLRPALAEEQAEEQIQTAATRTPATEFTEAAEKNTIAGWVEYLGRERPTKYTAQAEKRLRALVARENRRLATKFSAGTPATLEASLEEGLELYSIHAVTKAPDWLYEGEERAWRRITDQGAGELAAVAFLLFYPRAAHRRDACRLILGSELPEPIEETLGVLDYRMIGAALGRSEHWASEREAPKMVTVKENGRVVAHYQDRSQGRLHKYTMKGDGDYAASEGKGRYVVVIPEYRDHVLVETTVQFFFYDWEVPGKVRTWEEDTLNNRKTWLDACLLTYEPASDLVRVLRFRDPARGTK